MLVMRALGVLIASFLLAACPSEVGTNPPDPDARPIDDTSLPGNGVTIEFDAPALPLDLPDDVQLERVTLTAMTIRALGDVASDSRTTLENTNLTWQAGGEPMSITFDQAPTGVYSKVDIRITELELRGEVELEDNDRDFEIDGESMLIDAVIDVADTSLEGGGTVTFTINVDFASILAGIDWDQVRTENGKLTIEDRDPEMVAIRAAIDAAFRP
jgi:hypothetical protein